MQINPIKVLKTVASYNVSSSYVFNILSLGCILIPDLVVTDLFMHSLSGMILLSALKCSYVYIAS